MHVRVLGDPATVMAFRHAGIVGRAVRGRAEGEASFDEMLAEEDLGVLLVTEPVAAEIRAKVDEAKVTKHFPLVLEIPARGVPATPVDDLVARVARLVGLRA